MQDLRLIGVDEDGGHLLLASVDGDRFRVPLDESLRAAARRDRPRLGQLQIEIDGGVRPRDVQSMVRSGLTALEVAERSGWTIEKVRKYEGPILAEREYVAGMARAVGLRHRGRGVSDSLQQRVASRLHARGVAADSVEWDAWRRAGPEWTVVVSFVAGGRQRQAAWDFDVASRSLNAKDDEAKWLSEEEPAAADAPVPEEAPVYDVEAEGGIQSMPRRHRTADPLDLVTAMRERSAARGRRPTGRRRGTEPAALPMPDQMPATGPEVMPAEVAEPEVAETEVIEPEVTEPEAIESEVAEPEVAEPEATHAVPDAEPDVVPENDEPTPINPASEQARPARPARRTGRPSVPTWDDIVFGTKTKADPPS
ncbi:MAG: DUF3071 domain-containing protein [Actinomycetales bacterium]|nr:DUF3071 domain-containing protein [Actinomycetales bacterium]